MAYDFDWGSIGQSRPKRAGGAGQPFGISQQVNDAIMPYWSQAQSNLKAELADQGMLSSTGGMKRYGEQEKQFGQAANTMYADLQKQARAEQFQQQQANVGNAQNLYNLLWSAYLNQWQLKGTDKGLKAPQQFPLFQNVYNQQYQQPLSAYLPQNMGDSPKEYVPGYSPNQGQTLEAKGQAASEAYNKAYLGYLDNQAAEQKRQFDLSRGDELGAGADTKMKTGDWSGMSEYATQLIVEAGRTPQQAAEMALMKYGTAIKPYLDEGHEGAMMFLRSVFGNDAEAMAEWIAANSSKPYSGGATAAGLPSSGVTRTGLPGNRTQFFGERDRGTRLNPNTGVTSPVGDPAKLWNSILSFFNRQF